MFEKKYDLAIVNRSFWPVYPIIGEGLLRLAESYGDSNKVLILSQGEKPLDSVLKANNRGKRVHSKTYKQNVDSSVSLFRRIIESMGFMIWVFCQLTKNRPKVVYVSTDPPIVVPFIVFLYSKLFRANYIYHLQDIHPEITSIYLKKTKLLSAILKSIDNITLRGAKEVVVLSEQMKKSVAARSESISNIRVVFNPAYTEITPSKKKEPDTIIFCGNAGRLQRIPLLINSITEYLSSGGKLKFKFIGAGIYQNELRLLAERFKNVSYLGRLPADETAKITRECQWGLMPIEDQVTQYAFPSKSSTYAVSGVSVLAICDKTTSVAEWVTAHRLGLVIDANKQKLVETFRMIETGELQHQINEADLVELQDQLSFSSFVENLRNVICLENM